MKRLSLIAALFLTGSGLIAQESTEPADIRSVAADLNIPEISKGEPAAGKRVFVSDKESGVPFVLYLPSDWETGKSYPLIIELPGNGGYKNKWGDECSGRPEGCRLGYGITGGKGAIWVSAPFLNDAGNEIAITWWGSKPTHKPDSTVALLQRIVTRICKSYGGDKQKLILAGFSRGALATNAIGLENDSISQLWKGMICYSHYDGVHKAWPYMKSDVGSPLDRLKRLKTTPQFICSESPEQLDATRSYLESTGIKGEFAFCPTGFRNHNDAWILRPSPARKKLRDWFIRL